MAQDAPFSFSSSLPERRPGSPMARSRRCARGSLGKFVAFCCLAAPLVGCGAGAAPGLQSQMIADLESENARLQTELTELQEAKLQAERNACSRRTASSAEKKEKTSPPPDEPPSEAEIQRPELPVVKMGPETVPEESSEGVASIRPAAPVEATDLPENTRPVLKVRGQHEAWVYHRPLEESEKGTGSREASGASSADAGAE